VTTADAPSRKPASWRSVALRTLPWLITLACFAYLYRRIDAAAGPDRSPFAYLADVFGAVPWTQWLGLMLPYSLLYLAVDTLVLWRAVNWFNAKVPYTSLLPVRASAYILSILNEQVGKGAIAVYLNRTRGVPGWQVGSSMLFIMFCEFYYLLSWATLGYALEHERLPALFGLIPWIAGAALVFFVSFVAFFRAEQVPFGAQLRERDLLRAFREAGPTQYLIIVLLRSPAMIAAIWVYDRCAALFGVDIPLGTMLGLLPAIFFGTLVPGPFRAVAVALWPTLFPAHATEMTAFGFVQHNSFVLFNAALGLLFLRRANRELFGGATPAERAERA
jgi:hypothetical protein